MDYRVERRTDKYGDHSVLVRIADGEIVHEDGGEPEDQLLYRDKRDLVDELNRVGDEHHADHSALAALRAHIEAPEGDLVEAVDAWVAAAVEVEREKADTAWKKTADDVTAKIYADLDQAQRSRDAARAEVERLKEDLDHCGRSEMELAEESVVDRGEATRLRSEVERLTTKSERCGELTAEVERLRGLLKRAFDGLRPDDYHYARSCNCPGCAEYRVLRRDIEEAIRG